MRTPLRVLLGLVLAGSLAACSADAVGPTEAAAPATLKPSFLLAPGEGLKILADYVDAAGNHVMIAEYGAAAPPDGDYLASVTIKTVIPASGPISGACITSTIQKVDVTPGLSFSIKKPGGCDKEIAVSFRTRTGERALFRFLMIYGKTKIDAGLLQ
jgi:hypothetical protein